MIDIRPAAARTVDLLTAVTDRQLSLATPCPDACVGDLMDHLGAFAVRFIAAARKETDGPLPPAPKPSGGNLEAGWRERLSRDLLAVAEAWHDPRAWEGTTFAGSIELPAEVAGLVALDELIVHGWDIAAATGQPYEPAAADEIEAAMAFVTGFEAPRDGRLFGPVVPVPGDATELDRLLGLTGRDPQWRPPARVGAAAQRATNWAGAGG